MKSVESFLAKIDHWKEKRVKPHNHPNFTDEKILIRRARRDLHVAPDKNRQCDRLTSALFKYDDPAGYLSCDSHYCIVKRGKDPEQHVLQGGWDGAVQLTVAEFRSVEKHGEAFKIGMVPIRGNRCHGGVWGKIRRGQSNDLLRLSNWLVPIPGVSIV